MDKNTLSNYGWIVIAVLVLSVMIALATPFGSFIEQGVRSTTEGLFSTSQNAMNNAFGDLGVEVKDQIFEEGYKTEESTTPPTEKPNESQCCEQSQIITYVDDTKCDNCGTVTYGLNIHNGIVPEGGIYYAGVDNGTENVGDFTGATKIYKTGDVFPEEINMGDVYTFEDYEYRYNRYFSQGADGWRNDSSVNGWGVKVRDNNKVSYTVLLSNINNVSVTTMSETFMGCSNLTVAPEIPSSVISITGAFSQCDSLQVAPIIPANVQNMFSAFAHCDMLSGTITINATPISYSRCLQGTQITEIVGDCSIKNEILATK